MSPVGETRRVSDENEAAGARRRGELAKKRGNTVLGVPRKALGTVGVNTRKQERDGGTTGGGAGGARGAGTKRMVYHDSEGEETQEPEDKRVSKKAKAERQCPSPAAQTESPVTARGALVREPHPHRDLDALEADDLTMCVDYTNEIFAHLLQREQETTCLVNYVQDRQCAFYIRPSMRAILVDWLIEVHLKFQLLPEALYLAINIMDRYLSTNKVSLSKLQLVAITSLLIAAKFEEVNLPKLSNYVYITDNAYTVEEVKQSECNILNALEFNIGWPNPMNFLRRISKADNYNHNTRNYAKVFLEYAMCCPKFVAINPSVLAAMSMRCAMMLNYGAEGFEWDDTMEWYSSMATTSTKFDFQKLCDDLIKDIQEPSTQLNALIYKYKKLGLWVAVKTWCDEQKIVR
ncbi:AaceriAAR100Cp [[Ashbya] aceris (nom. inval.)]|nr:AaceriAAR100Cp [[Ashbya] aceris (nom. inval.)]